MKRLLQSLFLICITVAASAQANVDSVDAKVNKLNKFLDVLREFRIQMYVQPQFQYFDSLNADPAYAGGGNTTTSNNRFTLRRGRLKLSYEHDNAKGNKFVEAVFQMDMTERGFAVKDFYGKIIDPWTGWVGLQGGIFNRPFGFEAPYSSSTREAPERGRMSQIIFPGERDLGAALVVESPKTFKPVYLRVDAAVVNGLGNNFQEIDKRKDFIGSAHVRKTIGDDKLKFTIAGGGSFYYGGVLQSTNNVYQLQNNASGILKYTNVGDSTQKNKRAYIRQYYGADLQLTAEYKLGSTTLRGEFIAGQQPGLATANTVPTALGNDLYLRKFNGAYFYFIQTFKHKIKDQTISHDIVLKYDWYDPNTQIAAKDLSTTNDAKTSKADVKFQTIGVGYIFRPTDFFKLMLYYDIVMNEKTNITGYTRDLRDNILTVRTQFTFDSAWFRKK